MGMHTHSHVNIHTPVHRVIKFFSVKQTTAQKLTERRNKNNQAAKTYHAFIAPPTPSPSPPFLFKLIYTSSLEWPLL